MYLVKVSDHLVWGLRKATQSPIERLIMLSMNVIVKHLQQLKDIKIPQSSQVINGECHKLETKFGIHNIWSNKDWNWKFWMFIDVICVIDYLTIDPQHDFWGKKSSVSMNAWFQDLKLDIMVLQIFETRSLVLQIFETWSIVLNNILDYETYWVRWLISYHC